MSSIAHGLPARVRQTAAAMGAHADCMAAEPDNVCRACDVVLYEAMDLHYAGHGTPHEAMMAMLDDLLDEMQAQA